VTEMKRLN